MAQPGKAPDDFGQHQRRAVTVLDVGGVDHGMNEIAVGVSEDMALATFDLLARVIAARASAFRGFYALAVDHASTGRSLAAVRLACDHQQGVIDRQPQPVVAPKVEPVPHSRYGREARRQHPPRQAAAQQVKDRLDNAPQWPFARSPNMRRGWQQWLKNRPLGIGHITWQSQPASRMKGASGIGPHR